MDNLRDYAIIKEGNDIFASLNKKGNGTTALEETKKELPRDFSMRVLYFEPVTEIDRQKVNMECGSRIFLRRSQIYELALRNPYHIYNPIWEPPV